MISFPIISYIQSVNFVDEVGCTVLHCRKSDPGIEASAFDFHSFQYYFYHAPLTGEVIFKKWLSAMASLAGCKGSGRHRETPIGEEGDSKEKKRKEK
ncbi:hypothetical protein BgiMline_009647, partial [Biomphalaria glabrata]